MKKLFSVLIAGAFLLALTACAPDQQTTDDDKKPGGDTQETFEEKVFDGIGAVFDESLGYYNEHPSAIQEGATRWLFYTRNTVKYDALTDSIAVRKGTYSGGKWTYGDPVTCITTSETGWDSAAVFQADVVKGAFSYGGKAYSYLMAYSGSDRADRADADIGLAVAEAPDGEWVKVGTEPLIEFNSSEWDSVGLTWYPGAIEPSLVSYDKAGKVYLFYEESEVFKTNYAYELDCSDLDNIVRGGRKVIERSGITDLGTSNPLLYGADYVWDTEEDTLFAVREGRTTATSEPVVADEVQTLRASMDILDTIDQGIAQGEPRVWWSEVGDTIDGDATVDPNDPDRIFGYTRIFSPTIVSNEYGYLLEYGSLEVLFTTQANDGDERLPADRADAYRYSQMIHSLIITF